MRWGEENSSLVAAGIDLTAVLLLGVTEMNDVTAINLTVQEGFALVDRFVLLEDVFPAYILVSRLPPQMLLYQTLLILDQQNYTLK